MENCYTDGEIEDILIDTLSRGGDVFDIPYKGGAVFHNFTDARENLINWYPFHENASVLEIGAGMGALTGVLCEQCAQVVAFEHSPKRAEIIKQRHRDRTNLKVVCGDIFDYQFAQKFDYILLIGVLEYVGIGSKMKNPYAVLLEKIESLLKDNGKLLLAIENRFGLKYWCGAAEDHTGIPFDGVAGYVSHGYTTRYHKDGVCTFSRKELGDLLDNSGFHRLRWYYPQPDYKFPTVVFSDDYLLQREDMDSIKFGYPLESLLVAKEQTLYGDVIDNQVFPFFANSFFVEAAKNELTDNYVKYVSLKRDYKEQYRVATLITNQKEVIKRCVSKNAEAHLKKIAAHTLELKNKGISIVDMEEKEKCLVQKWQDFRRSDQIFMEYVLAKKTEDACRMIQMLAETLKKSSDIRLARKCEICSTINLEFEEEEEILKYGYIDMTFVNSFFDGNQFIFFDQEWKYENVPLKYILYRAIRYAYKGNDELPVKFFYEYFHISDRMLEQFCVAEEQVLHGMMDEKKCDRFDPDMYHEGLTLQFRMKQIEMQRDCAQKECNKKEQDIRNKEDHIEQLLAAERELKQIILNKEGHIEQLLAAERELKQIVLNKEGHIEQLLAAERELKQIVLNKEGHIEQLLAAERELKQTILNKEGHIEQLLAVEREYEREKHSRTYRMALVFRKISIFFLPENSKRRFFAKMLGKAVRHPRLMFHMINMRRIRNFFDILKKEGMDGINEHYKLVEDYENSKLNPFHLEQFEITNIKEDKKKEIGDYEKLSFAAYAQPDVSIIIPVYNQFEYTYNCLASILKNSGDVRYEVIVADDGSTDLTKDLDKVAENIAIIHNKENLRFLLNCNYAAKSVQGKYILFLNNDTQVQADWLRPLVDILDKNPEVGMTGSKLVYSDGYLQEAGGIFWKDASAWNYGNRLNPDDPEFNYVKEVDYISGASIMIRTSLWNEIGGFDERFAPAYYEDSDLAFEVRKHGFKVVYQPLSVVVHFEGISNGTDISTGQKAYQVTNQSKFYEKWKDVLEKENFPNGENVFLAKDRSRFKKQILVVDHYVPHYDKDAGGKCTYMYLLLFVRMGFKVTFIGDNFFKHEPYTTDLNQHGIEVLYGNYYFENWQDWLKENLHYFDYVYLQRPHISIKYIDLVKQYSHAKVLYFAHDLHHVREYREYLLTKDEEKLKSSEHWKKIEYELFEKADVGHVVGTYEQGIMQKAFKDKPIRNIPLYIYEDIPDDINKNFKERKDLVYVGGFGHPPNIDAVLWFGKEVFPKILKKYPEMIWHVVGGKVPLEIKEMESDNIRIEGFLPDEDLHDLYRTCRMAVVPLRVGAGVKGKVVEAAYYQIPLVTTTIGAEGLSREEGNMAVEDDANKMAELICNLYEDYEQLKRMSDAGAVFIQHYFTEEEAERVLLLDMEI